MNILKKHLFISCTFGFVLAMIVICFFPVLLTKLPISIADFSETGQIGDTIGGIIGPLVAIIASYLTFLAFWVQYKANEQQRNDISLERFENTLFHLIQIQENITNNLHYTPEDGADYLYGQSFYGRHVFDIIYCKKSYFYDNQKYYGLKYAIEHEGISAYENDREIHRLDYYFRHMYRIFKYIDDNTILNLNQKYEYTCIVRSSLSQYELVLLFYNCLSSNGIKKFKILIEKYALLNNLRTDLLATEAERTRYENIIQGNLEDYSMNFTHEYRKGAFIYNS